MLIQAVIFDLDGTLLDTIGDIQASLNHALLKAGLAPVSTEECRRRTGWGLAKLVSASVPEPVATPELTDGITRDFLAFYRENPAIHTVPYPGIETLLGLLRNATIKMAVLSNKPDALTRVVVEEVLRDHRFERVLGGRADLPHKPDPSSTWSILRDLGVEPEKTMFIGDSEVDMETARNAGCIPVGVSWGFREVNLLREAGAEHICYSADEIRRLLGLEAGAVVGKEKEQ
ncbi:MAG: HAD family hydrolase [Spirochaetaceae bacterium]|nr:MAG: HAD family hydrolase [Spirochaetaceae bacterium]